MKAVVIALSVLVVILLALIVVMAVTQLNRDTPADTGSKKSEPTFTDLCSDQVNPAWAELIEKNGLQQTTYEAWLADVLASGGTVFAPSKCSLPADSRIFAPGDTLRDTGPAQLVTSYRFDATWRPEVDVTYSVANNCAFEPLFNQGDAPIAVYLVGKQVRFQNNISNGVSLVGIVVCNQ